MKELDDNRPWYKLLNRYHWFVLVVAALGWLFDCLDQQLFILARPQAMEELLAYLKTDPDKFTFWKNTYGDIATSVFIAGWATGGLVFGMLGDRIGRARTMLITILMYSMFTGLSAFSVTVYDFAFYRFLTGLGVGGEFAVGVALVAEVMPSRARTYCLSLLQAFSAFGNISAALINMGLGLAAEEGLPWSPWRLMFLIGAAPALLAVIIRRNLKEPERWQQASHEGAVKKQLGSYRELFSDPTLRKHALLGLVLACSGVIGLWAIGFYTPDLARIALKPQITTTILDQRIAQAQSAGDSVLQTQLSTLHKFVTEKRNDPIPAEMASTYKLIEKEVNGQVTKYQSYTSIAINIGAFFGMFGFGVLAQRIGRKPTFAIALLAAFAMTIIVFLNFREIWQIYVLVPIMGFCQLSLFGGYAIYFPELFPTRLRSTGTSFCYNVGRFVAALGPLIKIGLFYFFSNVLKLAQEPAFRYGAATMCAVFLIGLLALPFLPETKGKPLPE